MPVIRAFKKNLANNSVYGQITIVCLAFMLMIISSYIYMSRIIRTHLSNEAITTLDLLQTSIESDMMEPEMLMDSISYSILSLIQLGYGVDTVREYIKDISINVIRNEKRRLGSGGLYGYFDIFDEYINDGLWQPPPDFKPRERPWYKTAVEAEGRVVFTPPYMDLNTFQYVISCSRMIFLDDVPQGVVTIDLSLGKITDYIMDIKDSEGRYAMLLDEELIIISHKNQWMINRPMNYLDDGIARITGHLERGEEVYGKMIKNYNGDEFIVFFRKLNNGWHIGLVSPADKYFKDIKKMGLALSAIGLLLAGVLCAILLSIAGQKRKSDSENRQKSEFLATMSHEIRTPMNAILGITEIQLQDQSLREDIKEALNKIYNSGDLLLGIINDILDLSKIEAGKLELVPVKYEVASLINDVVLLNKVRHENRPINFKLNVEETVPLALIGDELRIKQILNNILSNAFKYTEKGEVSLSINAEYVARGLASHVTLVFRVSDTGYGMNPDQIQKLFDEYSRFNLETNRTTQGTGLGMSITQKLVKMMDGDISVKSAPGKGTVVTVWLPQRNIGLAVSGMVGKELAENLQQFRMCNVSQIEKAQISCDPMPYGNVLIVDDVETNLYVAKGLLTPYELSIDTASSGFETVDKIKAGYVYDIIFMDHMMPKMDGIETTKIIRGMGYSHPVVALTANALVGQAEMFMENGFDGFISKPIDVRQLNSVLNKFVRDKQPYEKIEAARRDKAVRQASEKMTAETPVFLNGMKEVKEKFRLNESGGDTGDNDKAFLHEKLLIIQNACEDQDKKTAKETLIELKRKPWPRPVRDLLNAVIEQLLQDNFDEAASLANNLYNSQDEINNLN